jgi:hypothetical protein
VRRARGTQLFAPVAHPHKGDAQGLCSPEVPEAVTHIERLIEGPSGQGDRGGDDVGPAQVLRGSHHRQAVDRQTGRAKFEGDRFPPVSGGDRHRNSLCAQFLEQLVAPVVAVERAGVGAVGSLETLEVAPADGPLLEFAFLEWARREGFMHNRLSGHLLQAEKEPLVKCESGGLGESVFKTGPIRGFSANQGSIDIKTTIALLLTPALEKTSPDAASARPPTTGEEGFRCRRGRRPKGVNVEKQPGGDHHGERGIDGGRRSVDAGCALR